MRLRSVWPILSLFAALATAQSPNVRKTSLTGHVDHIARFHSTILGNDRNLIVYLPPDYDTNPNRRYPVLYMHDGQNIFDGMTSYIPNQEWRADEAAEGLIQAGLIEPLIIVGIDNAGIDRGNEFLPTSAKMGGQSMGGRADQYGKMIQQEIIPLINAKYRTKRGPKNTALAGSSFGGIITLYLGIHHPDLFGRLAVVSPSIWWDNRVMLKQIAALPAKPNVRIWLDIGTAEGNEAVKDTQDAAKALADKGFRPGKDLAVYIDNGAAHNESAWAGRIGMILLYLFGKR
jgi:predicted alpha/beta superfamily hydrolase